MVQISEVERRESNSDSEVTVTLYRNALSWRNCLTFLAQHFLDEEGMETIFTSLSKWCLNHGKRKV